MPEIDLTGRNRITWNIFCSWAAQLVLIVTGFVMPRMLDTHIGQSALGIWDFSWSIVTVFNYISFGIPSSVNRYVSKYRYTGDTVGLRRAVSSVFFVLLVVAFLVVALTAAATWLIPMFLREKMGTETDLAVTVVALLGTSLAVQIAFNTFSGVISGCHRWDLQAGLDAAAQVATMLGMVTVLILGGRLHTLALVYLCVTVVTEVARSVLAYRVCPELHICWADADWSQAKRMASFGGKTFIDVLSWPVLVQGSNILVASYLGPGTLAVYARPSALVRHIDVFVTKFARILTPATSAIQESGQQAELREFFIENSRFGVYIALPIMLVFVILGDAILLVWMGPRYEVGLVLTIMAVGRFLPIAQKPAVTILTGMNLHGRVGVINFGLALCGIALATAGLAVWEWELIGVTLVTSIVLTIGGGILIPMYACWQLGIPVRKYVGKVFLKPLLYASPFAICLGVDRVLFEGQPLAMLGGGGAAGILILGPLYWRYVLPPQVREKFISMLNKKVGLGKPVAEVKRGQYRFSK